MKNNIKNSIAVLLISFLTFSCVNENYDEPKNEDCVEVNVVKTKEVSDLYTLAGTAGATAVYHHIDPANPTGPEINDYIEAYVISSDEGGNFYKSMYFQPTDGSKGFNLSINVGDVYTLSLQPGKKVLIKMNGLAFANPSSFGRGLIIGAPPTEIFAVDRIHELDYKKYVSPTCTIVDEETIVHKVTLAQAKNDIYLNTLVELDNVEFTADFANGTYDTNLTDTSDSSTKITDNNNNTLDIRTSRFASFAGSKVPIGNGKIRGVLTKYNSGYQIIIRTERDVKLTNKRVGPLYAFKEDFTTTFPNWYTFSELGDQVWTAGTFAASSGTQYFAKISGYSSGNVPNVDWLISPKIDLMGFNSATLSFDTAKNFSGVLPLEVYVSNNYSGTGNPSSATWTKLTNFPLSTGTYTFVNSGELNITPYISGNFYVAFKYTSNLSESITWEVDNVRVSAKY